MVSKWPIQVSTLTEMHHETRLLTYVEREREREESSRSRDHIKSARGFDFRNDIGRFRPSGGHVSRNFPRGSAIFTTTLGATVGPASLRENCPA